MNRYQTLLTGCFAAGLLGTVLTFALGYVFWQRWAERCVNMEPTEKLVITGTEIHMEDDALVATCRLKNATGKNVTDAGYSAQFTGGEGEYYGTMLGGVDAMEPGESTDLHIKLHPPTEVTDASAVSIRLELFLPEENEEQNTVQRE